jgi:hypothetical protein
LKQYFGSVNAYDNYPHLLMADFDSGSPFSAGRLPPAGAARDLSSKSKCSPIATAPLQQDGLNVL